MFVVPPNTVRVFLARSVSLHLYAAAKGLTPLGYEALSNSKDALWACSVCLPASTEDNPVPKPGRPPKVSAIKAIFLNPRGLCLCMCVCMHARGRSWMCVYPTHAECFESLAFSRPLLTDT